MTLGFTDKIGDKTNC